MPQMKRIGGGMQKNLGLPSMSDQSGPVECLGIEFPNDEARREHFLVKLAEKLKDPEFRKIEGFPLGKDEDILALSDPPYYTACPNPWFGDFVQNYGKPYKPKGSYHREPFAADVSEGKKHALYTAHSYYTKVPHEAIMQFIMHYTVPGDIIVDGFAGTGMTGLAARLCASPSPVIKQKIEIQAKSYGFDAPKWGPRNAILSDLSPMASFIASNYNLPFDIDKFRCAGDDLLNRLSHEVGWMYETTHIDGRTKGQIQYTVWSEVFTCYECGEEVVFLERALDKETNRVNPNFTCAHCGIELTKRNMERRYTTIYDSDLERNIQRPIRRPVLIHYIVTGSKFSKIPDEEDLSILERISKLPLPHTVPKQLLPYMHMTHERARMDHSGITNVHHFYSERQAQAMGTMWDMATKEPAPRLRHMLLFLVEQGIRNLSLLNAFEPLAFSQNARGQKGVYYVPSQHSEVSPWYFFEGKLARLSKAFQEVTNADGRVCMGCGDAAHLLLPDDSVDYVFTDPPFGENIYYSDMNYLFESWHHVFTNADPEAIVDKSRKKGLDEYRRLIGRCMREYFRVLKPGRWITVVFSNSRAAVWNAIQSALQEAGFVVANVSALDKKQSSYRAVTSPTAVKQDLVISAYKPNGGLEERFSKKAASEEGVWEFIKTHLSNLPVVRPRGGQLEPIAERDPRILYDRTVAYYVIHNIPVPISSPEFQAGLADKFPERDGMYFLPEQAAEYDKTRMKVEGIGQLSIFVEDERSAANWLRSYLKKKPSKYQDIQPEFFEQLNQSWKKWETRPELRAMLDQYFLCYHAENDVPSQIHSYLSTNFKELRNLTADNAMLKAKARDRWYVPDPKNQVQVEQLREKRLLEEFWTYLPPGYEAAARKNTPQQNLPGIDQPTAKIPKGKRLAIVRTEAVRVGFNHCFGRNDYETIIAVAHYIPNDVIQNDEQLQMIYDSAVTRSGIDEE
ncbi:MAG: DNA methyltransferase [Pseudomonadota bacterium]